jgi:hypothetical protein
LLNRSETAAETEEFLQRFLYLSLLTVNSSGGTFVKWTGDGFLAFYESPLDRELGAIAEVIFEAIFFLTLIVNITQLCIARSERIRIRHAVTYEKDALLIDLEHSESMRSKDVLGRSVVAAFRLSGIGCDFPGIVTHKEVLQAFEDSGPNTRLRFRKLSISEEMRLRYFKGERFGTRDVYVSANKQPRKRRKSLKSLQKSTGHLLKKVVSGNLLAQLGTRLSQFRRGLFQELEMGPPWCRQVVEKLLRDFMLPGLEALSKFCELSPDAEGSDEVLRNQVSRLTGLTGMQD